MVVGKTREESKLTMALEGRLDTVTASELQKIIDDELDGVTELVMDLEKLEYISSAGLRVLLSAHKKMSKLGEMVIRNANEVVMEVFEITGFKELLKIELTEDDEYGVKDRYFSN